MGSTVAAGRSVSGFRNLPNPYAMFSPRLIFTTLTPKEVALGPYAHPVSGKPMHLFTLDDQMVYTPFKNDHGPLNLAYTFDACIRIYDKLNAKEHKRRALCLYTSPEPEEKSNLALIAALYSLIVEHQDPWDAYQPIAHFEVIPFRDAGNGVNEFALTIQDVLYGMWKAGQNDLLRLQEFDSDDYRYYEKVENGDLNVIGSFVAFASPMEPQWIANQTLPGDSPPKYSSGQKRMMVEAFDKVKAKFFEEDIALVIRLNDELYDRSHFVQNGIEHVDMYFDDGTNPTDEIVREFIRLSEDVILNKRKKIAVHCKAGLGRTGVLIGAYLIYKYHFTASEVIGFMRVIRPGMVVGPQQRYMQLNQMKWIGWSATDSLNKDIAAASESMPTPPMESDATLADVSVPKAETPQPLTPTRGHQAHKAGDAVGQPRKGPNGRTIVVEATPDPEELPSETSSTCSSREIKSDAPSPPERNDRQDSNLRGVKRGSGRSPVPQTLASTLETARPSLMRSTSNASCSSSVSELDQRNPKRRPADSPLSKSGLSSPPPSREVTPGVEEVSAPATMVIEEVDEPSTPPTGVQSLDSSQFPTPGTPPGSRSDLARTARSLIPRRGQKDNQMTPRASNSANTASATASTDASSASDSEGTTGTSPAAGSSKSKLPRGRILNSPRVWNTLSRIGGASLATTTND